MADLRSRGGLAATARRRPRQARPRPRRSRYAHSWLAMKSLQPVSTYTCSRYAALSTALNLLGLQLQPKSHAAHHLVYSL